MFSTTSTQEWNQNRETINKDSFWTRLFSAAKILFKGDTQSNQPTINTNPTTTAASTFNSNPISQMNRDYTSTWTNRKTGFTGTTGTTGYGGYTGTTGNTYRSTYNTIYNNGFTQRNKPLS